MAAGTFAPWIEDGKTFARLVRALAQLEPGVNRWAQQTIVAEGVGSLSAVGRSQVWSDVVLVVVVGVSVIAVKALMQKLDFSLDLRASS